MLLEQARELISGVVAIGKKQRKVRHFERRHEECSMIVRQHIRCGTCGSPHIARIQLGSLKRQEHTFPCYQCKEPIKIALDLDHKNVAFKIHLVENCVEDDGEEGRPIYLSSDFVANSDLIDQEFYFGSMEFMRAAQNSGLARQMMENGIGQETHRPDDEWKTIKKIWRLDDSKQYKLTAILNNEFAKTHKLTQLTLRENIWAFVNSVFKTPENLREEIQTIARKNELEFSRFIHFYQTNFRTSHRRSYQDILSDYFDNFNEHSQVFAYIRTETALPKNAKATSINFDRTKSFYAKAYEFFAEAICVYTCLNNIKAGRPFDKLSRISLSKYLETDKAKRRDSILDNSVFSAATIEFDSKVRNASFHNWFFLRDDHETIEYRSGGTGALETMTYTEYLMQCGTITSQIFNLFSVELELDESTCQSNCLTN